ncbi:hypothetical protein GJAV_G00060190 [Gymnothorax javanicus]|nr:hypothetical protein GJAV_G00060190 [Gymnothorax javanicus]
MPSEDFDCVVIGAGVHGSFTAYHLAKNGKKTLLLEQFVLPHSRGSSHGQTRIIRKAYEEDFYVRMMTECYQQWAQLEKEVGVRLYRQTGLLVIGPEKNEEFLRYKNSMERNAVPTITIGPENSSQYMPNVICNPEDGIILDTTAGVLYADRALRATQDVFRKLGGIIRDNEKVIDIQPGTPVTVMTASGKYTAKSVVITAGPWANTLLSSTNLHLPLKVVKINVCYWREKTPGMYSAANRFPCFFHIEAEGTEHHVYGLPSNEYPELVKICYHTGSETNPDDRDKQTDRSDIDILSRYISRHLPGLEPVPAVVESCMYTITPDRHFVLDRHPLHSNIVIGAGFSGHGFKLGPVVGKVLCEMALGRMPSYDLSAFKIQRFASHSKAAL